MNSKKLIDGYQLYFRSPRKTQLESSCKCLLYCFPFKTAHCTASIHALLHFFVFVLGRRGGGRERAMMLYICGKEKQPGSQVVSAEGPFKRFPTPNGIAKSQNGKLKVCLVALGRHENARMDPKGFLVLTKIIPIKCSSCLYTGIILFFYWGQSPKGK